METGSRSYEYIVSSIPMLQFGMKPPFSISRFIFICRGFIPEGELRLLETIDVMTVKQETLDKWNEFENTIRNEMARIRAGRKKVDPADHLRDGGYYDHRIYQTALHAYRSPNPLEGERILDQERWRFLDEISLGHYFDLDILVIYLLKLAILEKWERITLADSAALIEAALTR